MSSSGTIFTPLPIFETDKQLLPPGPHVVGLVPDLPKGEPLVVLLAPHLPLAGGQPHHPALRHRLAQLQQPPCPARTGSAHQGTSSVDLPPAVLAPQRHPFRLTLLDPRDLPEAQPRLPLGLQVASVMHLPCLHTLPADGAAPHRHDQDLLWQLAAPAAAHPRGLLRRRPRLLVLQPARHQLQLCTDLPAAQVDSAAPRHRDLPVPAAEADLHTVGVHLPALRRAAVPRRTVAQVVLGQPLAPADLPLSAETNPAQPPAPRSAPPSLLPAQYPSLSGMWLALGNPLGSG